MVPELLRAFKRCPANLAEIVMLFCLLAGCAGRFDQENTGTVTPATVALMEQGNMERAAPILVRVFKEESRLDVWKQDRSGLYKPLKSYAICRYSGTLGPKKYEGDHQAPEGFYQVGRGQMNPHSREYLAFNVGYPNAFDRAWGRTGDSLMVHGGCRSVGCYAMTNEQVDEIYGLAYEAFAGGQRDIQLQAFPFRLTDANLARHETDPNIEFWRMLKQGSDLFDATGLPPQVSVCDKRYVFSASTMVGSTNAAGLCPAQFTTGTAGL